MSCTAAHKSQILVSYCLLNQLNETMGKVTKLIRVIREVDIINGTKMGFSSIDLR